MPTTGPTPVLHIRIIGAANDAQALIADIARHARTVLGPHHTYRTTTRPARRAGHIRAYLTITRRENLADDPSQHH